MTIPNLVDQLVVDANYLADRARLQLPLSCGLALGRISEYGADFFPEEWNGLAPPRARIKEFNAGRALARQLLLNFQINTKVVPRTPSGAPGWPNGIVGSISHKSGIVGALISPLDPITSIGFDIEVVESLDESIWSVFATPEEVNHSAHVGINSGVYANMLFSIKESLFKCLCPIYGLETPHFSERVIFVDLINNQYVTEFSHLDTRCVVGAVASSKLLLSWALAYRMQEY